MGPLPRLFLQDVREFLIRRIGNDEGVLELRLAQPFSTTDPATLPFSIFNPTIFTAISSRAGINPEPLTVMMASICFV
jgi:hypothetical protein